MWIDYRSIDAQNVVIEQLKKDVADWENRNSGIELRINKIRSKADFYLDMQYRIIDNPDIMKVWRNFLTMVKLTLDNPIKGITHL